MNEAPQPSSIRRTSGSWSTSRTVLDRLFSHVLERLRTTTAWRPPRCRSPCPTSSLHRYSTEDRSGSSVKFEAVLTRACRPMSTGLCPVGPHSRINGRPCHHYAGGLRGIPAPPSPRPPDEARGGV